MYVTVKKFLDLIIQWSGVASSPQALFLVMNVEGLVREVTGG